MKRKDAYHNWYTNNEIPGILYVTANGQIEHNKSYKKIGYTKKIDWLEKKLNSTNPVPIEEVFYQLDINDTNELLTSEYMEKRMNCQIRPIQPGQMCKVRELIFYRAILDSPKLTLFHDYFDRDESTSFIKRIIKKDDGTRNTNLWGTEYVGKMIAVPTILTAVQLIPQPVQIEETIDYKAQIKKLKLGEPKDTLGDFLAPLLEKYKK